MSSEPPDEGSTGPGRRRAWWGVSVALGLLGAVLVGAALLGLTSWKAEGDRSAVGKQPATSPSPSEATGSASASPTPSPRVPPVRLRIPAIELSRNLLRMGLNADRTVQVPTSAQADLPGWYRLGPAPGQAGSAVILGHVDSVRGPAVFYRLRSLTAGDRVEVDLRDGTVAHFKVQRVATYLNEDFPAGKVYAPRGYPALQLVTCGGDYDPETGYTANVVAYTRLVGISG